jgi:hypothetical protein
VQARRSTLAAACRRAGVVDIGAPNGATDVAGASGCRCGNFGGDPLICLISARSSLLREGAEPPANRAALLECLTDIAPPHVLAVARSADPLADVAHYRFPSNRWRRYDKLTRTPDALIVVGDAMCSFNPLYGQGMSVAAIEALILRDCLQRGSRDLPQRFFRASAKEIRTSWRAAVGSDLALPQIPGKRPMSVRLTNAYLDRVLAAAETDPAVVQQFLRLISMLDSPSHLLRPATMLRIIKTPRKQAAPKDNTTSAGPRCRDE